MFGIDNPIRMEHRRSYKLQHAEVLKVAAGFQLNSQHVKHNGCMGKSFFSSIIQLPSFEIWLMYDLTGLNFTTRALPFLSPSFCQSEVGSDSGTAGE